MSTPPRGCSMRPANAPRRTAMRDPIRGICRWRWSTASACRRYGGDAIDRLFTNTLDAHAHPYFREIAGLRVSAHVLIRRDGALVQYVPFHERAWHAGHSCWGTREACNDFAVGIELEGTDEQPYEEVQYRRLAGVVAALATAYPRFDRRCLAGHCDVAPGRKTDPGPAFDWRRLDRLLEAEGSIAGSSAG